MRRRRAGVGIAVGAWALAQAVAAFAEPPPAGWKLVKDRKGNCQMLVPAAWKGGTSSAAPEDRQAMAAIHLLPGKDWAESKAMARHVMEPFEVVEDSPARLWFVYATRATLNPADVTPPDGKPGKPAASARAPEEPPKPSEVAWYVSVPGPLGPCTAQITFKSEALAETARAIAASVAASPAAPAVH